MTAVSRNTIRDCVGRAALVTAVMLVVASLPLSSGGVVVINELLASTSEEDDDGIELEWVELYNSGSRTVDLAGYTITDDVKDPRQWVFPAVSIPARDFLVVWATGEDRTVAPDLHTNFRLRRGGEYLGLYHPDGTVSDALTFPEQKTDYSYGRFPDGDGQWQYFSSPTRGASNVVPGMAGIVADVRFSKQAGVYPDGFLLTLGAEDFQGVVHYTLDGSTPTESSTSYNAPIEIQEPTVIRARAFRAGYYAGDTRTKSYIIRPDMPIPILSLVTDPDHLWDRRNGIYTNSANRGRDWERPVSVEYFKAPQVREFREDCGIRIHGGASRMRSPRLSFRLYFRSHYGAAKLRYPLFPDTVVNEFDVLVLRGGFNDTWTYDRSMQRDTAIYVSDQVVRDLDLDAGRLACHGIFNEVYLNGQYWGLYNTTERLNDDFMESYRGYTDWDVIVDNEAADGDLRVWNRFISWVRSHSMRDAGNYQEMQQRLDLQSFTDYIILNVWLQNYDWPHHNWYAARAREDGAKWLFFMWDVEYSFGSGIQGYRVNQNTWGNAVGAGPPIGVIFSSLIQNDDYRVYFWTRLQSLYNTVLRPEHVAERLEARLDEIRAVIPDEGERWAQDKSLEDWEHAAQLARDFIAVRTSIVTNFVEAAIGPAPVPVLSWALHGMR